jgi:ubiquinone/menaquinone biosynthesis C-methylase UbiE
VIVRDIMDEILEKIRHFSDDQYSSENRLNARIQIYEYRERKLNWREWVFDKLDFTGVQRVLDIGCGNGVLWQDNIHKLPKDTHIVLTDNSEGLVDAARKALGKHDGRFEYKVADACHLPYEDGSFQMVIANHVLYHIENKGAVLGEIDRLLVAEGSGYASTLSTTNLQELLAVVGEFSQNLVIDNIQVVQSFNLENGESVLSRRFTVLEKNIFQNNIIINNAEPLVLYLASCYTPKQLDILVKNYTEFKTYLETTINKAGELRITNKNGLFRFSKK